MPKYRVSYTVTDHRSAIVEATSQAEAIELVQINRQELDWSEGDVWDWESAYTTEVSAPS